MRCLALLFLAFCLSFSAYAETAADASKELGITLSAIRKSDRRQKELAQKTAALQAELNALQEETVSMGKDSAEEEGSLSSYEEKLAILEDQKKEKTRSLEARQSELSSMISAMVKLRQLPPEAVIAMPGKLDETLATARALGIVTHAIEEEAQSLKGELRELDILEAKIRHDQENIASRKTALSRHQLELAAKIKERNRLVEALGGQARGERERTQQLTAKSKTLQELVDSLKKSESVQAEREETPPESPIAKRSEKASAHKLRSFASARGAIRMPAAGKVIGRYGDRDWGETFSKGMLIETRGEANVVAPFDGEIVFAGTFRDYGHIVIIRHGGDYHTMLSGMEEIDCKPGQYVLEGEPVGTMGSGSNARLYLELREDGKPVDPKDWVKG